MNIVKGTIKRLYKKLFVRKIFYNFYRVIFKLCLRGMGILNFEDGRVSGEISFLNKFFSNFSGLPLVIFDIGANLGNYSKLVRSFCPKALIYAFEPHPVTYLKLKQRTAGLNVFTFNFGFGEREESVKLFDYKHMDSSAHASLYKEVFEKIHKEGVCEYSVNIMKLDDFFANDANLKQIDLLKIDTEGNEFNVLLGARKLIEEKMIDVIQIEFNEMNIVSRVFMKDFFDLLKGYSFFRILPDGLVNIDKYDPIFCEIFAFQNIVAIRRGSKFAKVFESH